MKNGFVVVVLVATGWAACMTRTSGTQGTEPRASESQALAVPQDREQTDGGCATGSCADGGTNCLDIEVTTADSGTKKTFDPPPRGGWKMCVGQALIVDSALDEALCVDLRNGTTPVFRGALSDVPPFTLQRGKYCLTVCKPKDAGTCLEGCENSDCSKEHTDTIRGNLDVITKVPDDPIEDRK